MRHAPERIAEWLRRIVGHEGGYTRDPNDPGNWTGGHVGAGDLVGTKWGVAANTYGTSVSVKRGMIPIPALTVEDAAEVFARDYLAPLRADRFDDGVAYQLLDFRINSGAGGIQGAVKRLQHLAGDLQPDGVIGPQTLARMAQYTEAQIVMLILHARIHYLTGLRNWDHAGRGWMRRVADNLLYGVTDTRT
jgi:lysozyme family protein